jgi:hypothetical protein
VIGDERGLRAENEDKEKKRTDADDCSNDGTDSQEDAPHQSYVNLPYSATPAFSLGNGYFRLQQQRMGVGGVDD